MRVDIVNMHRDVLAHFTGTRAPKLGPMPAQHDSPIGDVQLGMTNAAASTVGTQALLEPECVAQPVDGLTDHFNQHSAIDNQQWITPLRVLKSRPDDAVGTA
jgi:hypothetical protein